MEPGCSETGCLATDFKVAQPDTRQGRPEFPKHQLLKAASRSQRSKRAKSHLVQLARELYLTGERKSIWALLPINLLIRVLKLLTVFEQGRCACVCRRWNAAYHMPDIWHKFVFEFTQKSTLLSRSTPELLIKNIFEGHSRDLRHVSIKVDGYQHSVEAACHVLNHLVHCHLQTMKLISIAGPSFRTVERKKVKTALAGIFSNCHFKSLAVEETPLDDALLDILTTNSRDHLASLRINICPQLSSSGLAAAMGHCVHLSELSMDYTQLSDALLQALCTPTHVVLQNLSINVDDRSEEENSPQGRHIISGQSWDLLARHSPEVTLAVQFAMVNEEQYYNFFHCKIPLTSLQFRGSAPPAVLGLISTFCPRLRELAISGSGNEPINKEIVAIGDNCKDLEVLELGVCVIHCSTVVRLAGLCGPRLTRLVLHDEMTLEDGRCDFEIMSQEVARLLQRPWGAVSIPTWF